MLVSKIRFDMPAIFSPVLYKFLSKLIIGRTLNLKYFSTRKFSSKKCTPNLFLNSQFIISKKDHLFQIKNAQIPIYLLVNLA
jgi:hypothetical protein